MARQINEFLPSSERSGQTMHGSNKSWHEAQEEREAQAEHHKRRMHRLWQVMRETYASRWTASYGENPTRTWMQALAGLTTEQIKRAVDRAVLCGDQFPPTLPQFIDWAKGDYAEHRLMEPEEAYQAASHGEYWHRGLYHAVSACGGTYAFRRLPDREARRLFAKAWRETLEAVRDGKRIKAPPIAPPDAKRIAQPGIQQRDIEVGLRAMAKIKATLGMPTDMPEESDAEE
jgi:hypothetical protein